MYQPRKVIIPVKLKENDKDVLSQLRQMEFLSGSEVHLVHVFETTTYTKYFTDFPQIYPVTPDSKMVQESINVFLSNLAQEILPLSFQGKVITKCLFDEPKSGFSHYVEAEKPDLVVIPTRQKRGMFESSFAQYVAKHTQANLFLLKGA